MHQPSAIVLCCAVLAAPARLSAQSGLPMPDYHIYAGSLHAHTAYTWSHGEQFAKGECAGIVTYAPNPAGPLSYRWSDGYVKAKTDGCPGYLRHQLGADPRPRHDREAGLGEIPGAAL